MWRRQEANRDFFWIGVVVGLATIGLAVVGFLLGTEMGRNTRTRLGQTVQRVRSRINGFGRIQWFNRIQGITR